jgi:carbamoyltransferase
VTYILGISAFYHDSAACLLCDGEIVAAVQEERFTRKKNDQDFPRNAIRSCLEMAQISPSGLDFVVFYDKPLIKFERILETHLGIAPRGFSTFIKAIPLWLKSRLHIPNIIRRELGYEGKIAFTEHHESHAGSAFYPSPFQRAAILTVDGVGEWATTSYGRGEGNRIELLGELHFPHSLGLLYSAFTYFIGFKVNSGEYKLMGLAPYGEPRYVSAIRENLLDLKEDGSFRLNMEYFNYLGGLTMTNARFEKLFGGPPRPLESTLTQREMDLARSIQVVTEEVMLRITRHLHGLTGERYLCLAGGVALNCVANGRLLREGPFEDIWIQPAAGDAGGALGAAFCVHHRLLGNDRFSKNRDGMKGSFLGPSWDRETIETFLRDQGIPYRELSEEEVPDTVAQLLCREQIVGWFQGRMEFGPRALGARSILGDPRSEQMQSLMNRKIKFRESFRPFAPSVLAEKAADYFELDRESPYMLLVVKLRPQRRIPMTEQQQRLFGIEKLNVARSDIPAVTHVDYSARIQTVCRSDNPRFYDLLRAFTRLTGCPLLINTSFNVRGEPIVCSPADAYRCFMRTEIDYLVLGNFLLDKHEQPVLCEDTDWQREFQLD